MKKSTVYGMMWGGWLGGCLGCLGYGILTWQFWLVFAPVVILTALEKTAFKEEE